MLQLAREDFDRSTLIAHMFLKLKPSIRDLVQFPRPLTRAPILRTEEEKACPLTWNGVDDIVLLRTSKWRGSKLPPHPPRIGSLFPLPALDNSPSPKAEIGRHFHPGIVRM